MTSFKRYITATVWIKKDKEIIGRMRPQKIFVYSKTKGVIIKDGRPVVKRNGKWIYQPK